MTTRQFLIFLARKMAQIALLMGYEEFAHTISDATVEYMEEINTEAANQ